LTRDPILNGVEPLYKVTRPSEKSYSHFLSFRVSLRADTQAQLSEFRPRTLVRLKTVGASDWLEIHANPSHGKTWTQVFCVGMKTAFPGLLDLLGGY